MYFSSSRRHALIGDAVKHFDRARKKCFTALPCWARPDLDRILVADLDSETFPGTKPSWRSRLAEARPAPAAQLRRSLRPPAIRGHSSCWRLDRPTRMGNSGYLQRSDPPLRLGRIASAGGRCNREHEESSAKCRRCATPPLDNHAGKPRRWCLQPAGHCGGPTDRRLLGRTL